MERNIPVDLMEVRVGCWLVPASPGFYLPIKSLFIIPSFMPGGRAVRLVIQIPELVDPINIFLICPTGSCAPRR